MWIVLGVLIYLVIAGLVGGLIARYQILDDDDLTGAMILWPFFLIIMIMASPLFIAEKIAGRPL